MISSSRGGSAPRPGTNTGGPFQAIPTSVPGIHISELLPQSAKIMHHLAILRSVHTQDNSHSAGVARIQRGDPKNRGVTYPYFGSAVAKFLGPGESGLPPYVWIKPGSGGFIHQDAGFLGPKFGAVAFGDGKPPENQAWGDYVSLKIFAQVMNELKTTNTTRIIEHLEKQPQLDILKTRSGYYRSWDHQSIGEMYTMTKKPKDKSSDRWNWLALSAPVPGSDESLEVIGPKRDENPCSLA